MWARTNPHPERANQAAPDPRTGERGVALIVAIFFTIFGIGLILSGTVVMDSSVKKTDVAFRLDGQARQFAEAGLIDALAWFRRQTTQPVTAFDPKRDMLAVPPIIDTDDPEIGIVREFEISRGIWGRYEVRRFVPNVEPPVAEVADISKERGASTTGTVWRIVSRGFVFRRKSAAVAFNEFPNQVLGVEVMETEVRRMTLTPPAYSALCVSSGSGCTIAQRGRVFGGLAAGVSYRSGTNAPTITGEVFGNPPTAAIANYTDTTEAVFGVDRDQLRSLADDRITSSTEFPNPVPTHQILFAETDLTFDNSRPLKGTGIVYVEGNVTIQPGSNTFFNGLLYVTGNVTVNAPALLRGTVIARGNVNFSGLADYAQLEYDDGVLNSLMLEVGQYRLSSSVRRSALRGSLNQ